LGPTELVQPTRKFPENTVPFTALKNFRNFQQVFWVEMVSASELPVNDQEQNGFSKPFLSE